MTHATAVAESESLKSADDGRLTSQVRRALRLVRRVPERLLHPVRRARIRRELSGIPESPIILVICLGNICRSPYAELVLRAEFRKRGREEIRVESAGFIFPDRPSPPEAQRAAARRGQDLMWHRSRVIRSETVERADVILVMSRQQQLDVARKFGRTNGVLILGDADPGRPATRTIKDPIERPMAVFESVYERLDRCCAAIAAVLSAQAHRAGGSGDESGEARCPGGIAPE